MQILEAQSPLRDQLTEARPTLGNQMLSLMLTHNAHAKCCTASDGDDGEPAKGGSSNDEEPGTPGALCTPRGEILTLRFIEILMFMLKT